MGGSRSLHNIVLCGFMAVGKSTVCRQLAESHGFRTLDTDQMVEQQVGISIPVIFSRYGERTFRRYECEAVRRAASCRGAVIATGGGAILDESSRSRLAETGFLVYLRASLHTLSRRLRSSPRAERPLLQSETDLSDLFETRRSVYESLDFCVETDDRRPSQIADDVVAAFYLAGGVGP